ncbi:aladin [Entomortierella parvispora]|uniref:Aladin n=1 Tax=Entomortierella parvispora TaxID=205924 RepID=A0A9P3H639_9FUNG|nr:aladin [Entomortierella parvispora]
MLDALQLPPHGHITIGESNSALVHVAGPQDLKLSEFIKKHGELKAALTMPSRNTHIPHHSKINSAVEELLKESEASGLIPQPIVDKIEELLKQWDLDAILDSAGAVWKKAWDLYISLSGSVSSIVHHDRLAKLLIRTVAWHPHQPLVAIALWNNSVWVYDLSVESWYSCGLSHPAQSRVMKLEWKPMSGVVLAIACLEGVALWDVYRDHKPNGADTVWSVANPAKDRPSELLSETFNRPTSAANKGGDTAWLGLARMEGLKGVDQISWDPRGELLAIGSEHSSTVFIRENAAARMTELRLNKLPTPPHIVRSVQSLQEIGSTIKAALGSAAGSHSHATPKPSHKTGHYGPTVCCLRWSPSGEHLLVGYRSGETRIYETATWEYVSLKNMTGVLKTACWSPDGFNLIFTLEGDDQIRAIHFEKRSGDLTWIPLNSLKLTLQPRDIEAFQESFDQNGIEVFGRSLQELENFGPVEELALDQNGERLVVRFRDTDLLGVILVRPTGSMLRDLDIFMPMGFIQGPGWNGKEVVSPADDDDDDDDDTTGREPKATTMAFTSHFKGGSMLGIAWESGRINFVPFYYLSQKDIDSY